MFRKLTISCAVMAVCALGSAAVAQTDSTTTAGGETGSGKVELASYGANYASGGYGQQAVPQAMAFGQAWGGAASNRDCSRFYHYPYVFYPQNFRGDDYYRSSDSMYYRYPAEMQIPVYNRGWHNYYPSSRRYHSGHHFILDVF